MNNIFLFYINFSFCVFKYGVIRQGQMCSRCLRNIDDRASIAETASMIGGDDDDDQSIMDLMAQSETPNQHMFGSTIQIKVNSLLANFIGFLPFGESFL